MRTFRRMALHPLNLLLSHMEWHGERCEIYLSTVGESSNARAIHASERPCRTNHIIFFFICIMKSTLECLAVTLVSRILWKDVAKEQRGQWSHELIAQTNISVSFVVLLACPMQWFRKDLWRLSWWVMISLLSLLVLLPGTGSCRKKILTSFEKNYSALFGCSMAVLKSRNRSGKRKLKTTAKLPFRHRNNKKTLYKIFVV